MLSLLVACAGPPHPPPPASPVPPPREEMPQPPVRPHPRIVPHPARKPAAPQPPPGPPAAAPTTPAAPARNGELIGLDQDRAAHLFGSAEEKIEQPPATIWRYKTSNCELDLFFYLDLRSGRMRTLHYAFKGDVDDTEKRQDCLRAIVAARGS